MERPFRRGKNSGGEEEIEILGTILLSRLKLHDA